MLTDLCADPGIFARVVQVRLPENSSDNVFCLFCPQLLQFYSGLKTIILQGFVGGGGGGRVQPIPGGGGGGAGCPNANSRDP